ncbi:MAG: hypothetical protein J0M18_15680 [Ignavibacteria bacterium]|jgi:hypothetical protein|nr:hypothetical protein [Ignavibacteria bacterium]
MATEFYIVKLRLLSALRWIRELGFVRIVVLILLAAGVYNSLYGMRSTPAGIAAIILLGASIIYSVHFSRKDEFILSSLNINKKLLFSLEYFLYSLPFIILILSSEKFYFIAIIFILIGVIINIKSGNSLKINLSSAKSLFPVYAFEWIAGLRANFIPIFIVYLLGLVFCFHISGGVLAIILLTLIFSSFFIENEQLLFIEAYKMQARKFLISKLLQSAKIFFTIIFPIALLHLIFFYERWYLITGVTFICLIIILASVLTKYAFYSEEIPNSKMNYIINGVIVFSFVSAFYMTGPFLFPLPFIMIIYLYKKASQNLKNVRYIAF